MPKSQTEGGATTGRPATRGERLDSWKTIAAYFDRTVRTVQRWEREEGLPVHRHQHGRHASVFAYTAELDGWWEKSPLTTDAPERESNSLIAASREPKIPRLAILPFCPVGPEPTDESLPVGLADALISKLAKLDGLRVIASDSISRIQCERPPLREIASRLGVDYIVDASLLKAGGRYRATVKLIRAADSSYLWAEQFEFSWAEIFEIQNRVAQCVLDRLELIVKPGQCPRLFPGEPRSVKAYELFLRGRHQRTHFDHIRKWTDFARAEDLLKQAALRDPGFSATWAELSFLYWLAFETSGDPRWVEKTVEFSAEALKRDPRNATANTTAALTAALERRLDRAFAASLCAVEDEPSHSFATVIHGAMKFALGLCESGLVAMERGARLDPLCVLPACALIGAYAAVGREADSRRWTREALRLEPRAPVLFSVRGTALLFQAKYSEARELLENSLAATPGGYRGLFEVGLGAALGAQGERARARAILERYRENPLAVAPWTFPAFVMLAIHAGDFEAGLALLERDVFYSSYPCLLSIRAYDPLRGSQGFTRLLARRYDEWQADVRRLGEPAAVLPAPQSFDYAR